MSDARQVPEHDLRAAVDASLDHGHSPATIDLINEAVAQPGLDATLEILRIAHADSKLERSRDEVPTRSRLAQLITTDSQESAAARLRTRQSTRTRALLLASAAALMLAAAAVPLFIVEDRAAQPLGHVTSLSANARWADREIVDGFVVRGLDRLELEAGTAILELPGVRVDLLGPVAVTIESGARIRLHKGMVGAFVAAAGHGFTVRTDDLDAVDLGTEFAVARSIVEGTSVAVTDGVVNAILKDVSGNESRVVELFAGQQARFEAREQTLVRDGFDVAEILGRFMRVREVRGGIRKLSGGARAFDDISDALDLREGVVETGGRVYFVPEQRGVELTEPVTLETVSGRTTLPAGTVIDSYLAHYDIGRGATVVEGGNGAVSFGTPVLGVLATAAALTETDETFGLPGAAFAPAAHRGLEPDEDAVKVTSDRSAITFDVATTPGQSLDQFRVLVRARNP
ncbi:MAG: hypothetical protein AAF532_00055 [Planctomycetota bacterium]